MSLLLSPAIPDLLLGEADGRLSASDGCDEGELVYLNQVAHSCLSSLK